jgi:hypothetical protein
MGSTHIEKFLDGYEEPKSTVPGTIVNVAASTACIAGPAWYLSIIYPSFAAIGVNPPIGFIVGLGAAVVGGSILLYNSVF